jgi:hypothetical protein
MTRDQPREIRQARQREQKERYNDVMRRGELWRVRWDDEFREVVVLRRRNSVLGSQRHASA